MIDVGQTVPDLPLALSATVQRPLREYRGHWLVLYFYPRDNTPGCTTEGRDFNAAQATFEGLGAVVVGVSRDSLQAHRNFVAKHGFTFELASDADGHLCSAFDVIREKSLYGRKSIGIERSTFLIDPAGVVRKAWRRVRVAGHVQAVIAALQDARAG